MKTMTAIAITLMLATRTEAAPPAEPQQSTRCVMSPKPFCLIGQAAICVCQDQFSYDCIWMCASAR